MDKYNVTGMSCAACQANVERAVKGVEGVTACSVSLLTNSMSVEGTADPSAVIGAVENAGYGASLKGSDDSAPKSFSQKIADEEEALRDKTTPLLKKRLAASVIFLLVLMYFSMGHMMWGFPVPAFFEGNHTGIAVLQMLLAGIVMVINQHFFVNGFKGLLHKAPNMDSTIALGSAAAFIYSAAVLILMTRAQTDGNSALAHSYMMDLYFESAAMILTLITVGKMLESYSKGKTTNALKSLMKLAPKTATLLEDGAERTVPVDSVKVGDIFVVRPGENIPVDGKVIDGDGAVDESALTGESIPVDKTYGSEVSAATTNIDGFLTCKATKVGEDSTLAQIISMVSDAAATKAPVARLADRISGVFVPAVIGIAIVTTIIWIIAGRSFGFALARGICVLVVSCPCALGLATPVAIMVGNGIGARNGILFKTAEALQETGNIDIAALDKTGTITSGQPKVTDVCPVGMPEEEMLAIAAGLEKKSSHPLAKAVASYADEKNIKAAEIGSFENLPGSGLKGELNGEKLYAGNCKFINSIAEVGEDSLKLSEELSLAGKTPLFFAKEGKLIGIIAVADSVKEDSAKAIAELRNMGIRVVMLTGDNGRTANAIGSLVGVDEVISDVLPDGKEAVIRSLQEKGKVAMVGDGINDAPALTRADIGIAIGAGTDVAIDAADVVLMKSRLSDVSAAVRLSRSTYRGIVQNLFWALIYNCLLIPVAAGALVHAFGITMNPMLGAAAMSLSSFFVVSNALRLNLVNIHDASKDRPKKSK